MRLAFINDRDCPSDYIKLKIIIMELDNILFANLTFVYKILYVMVPISFNDT